MKIYNAHYLQKLTAQALKGALQGMGTARATETSIAYRKAGRANLISLQVQAQNNLAGVELAHVLSVIDAAIVLVEKIELYREEIK